MLRDMELVRDLLTQIANDEYKKVSFSLPLIGTRDGDVTEDEKIAYHLDILRGAGLITFEKSEYKGGMRIHKMPQLTWMGQDYYGAISNENVWDKTKQTIQKSGMKVGEVSLDIIVALAKVKVKEMFGLPVE